MTDDPLYVLAVLAANVAFAEWLARRRGFRLLGSALLVIVTTAVCANTGVIPPYSAGVPVYDGVFRFAAPLGIFWLLLQVDLRHVLRAGGQMLTLFALGSVGVMLGVFIAMRVVDGGAVFGERAPGLGAMFTGTYIGGSVNFNAMALHCGLMDDPILYAGANAVDASMTTVWMIVTLLVPRLLGAVKSPAATPADDRPASDALAALEREVIRLDDLAWLLLLGAGAAWVSDVVAAATSLPSILILSTLALALAQVPAIRKLSGGGVIGIFAVMLFLAVIGALSDVAQFRALGPIGVSLLALVSLIFLVHGAFVFGAARLFRLDPAAAGVASQAAVGGATTALALARALGRADLELPAILVGSLGLALGNYAGLAVLQLLGG